MLNRNKSYEKKLCYLFFDACDATNRLRIHTVSRSSLVSENTSFIFISIFIFSGCCFMLIPVMNFIETSELYSDSRCTAPLDPGIVANLFNWNWNRLTPFCTNQYHLFSYYGYWVGARISTIHIDNSFVKSLSVWISSTVYCFIKSQVHCLCEHDPIESHAAITKCIRVWVCILHSMISIQFEIFSFFLDFSNLPHPHSQRRKYAAQSQHIHTRAHVIFSSR